MWCGWHGNVYLLSWNSFVIPHVAYSVLFIWPCARALVHCFNEHTNRHTAKRPHGSWSPSHTNRFNLRLNDCPVTCADEDNAGTVVLFIPVWCSTGKRHDLLLVMRWLPYGRGSTNGNNRNGLCYVVVKCLCWYLLCAYWRQRRL